MVAEDKIDRDAQNREVSLVCRAKIPGQSEVKVGDYIKLVPTVSSKQTPDVTVLYPDVVTNPSGHKTIKDTAVCVSNKRCKVVAIFGGL